MFRYGKMIDEYNILPWWKKLFRGNPEFRLEKIYDNLYFPRLGCWYMRLKTIEGTYKVYGYDKLLCTWVHDMYPKQKFSHVRLVLKWIHFKEKAGSESRIPAFFLFCRFFCGFRSCCFCFSGFWSCFWRFLFCYSGDPYDF